LNPNVEIINNDAFRFLSDKKNEAWFDWYDFIIADFTDPRDVWVAKLYSKEFYLIIKSILKDKWVFVTQSWNAFFARESFWCINKTLLSAFDDKKYKIIPYKTYIPSFWDWWFNAVINWEIEIDDFYKNDLVNTKFDKDYLVDMKNLKINTIESPSIIRYFTEWRKRFNL
jgi:spermidine synthase